MTHRALLSLLLAGFVFPTFASAAKFDVKSFGAVGDGKTKDTSALQHTIDAAAKAGGGTVTIPPGTYLIGSIQLASHVRLELPEGATLLGSQDPADYPFVTARWEGEEVDLHASLVSATDAVDVTITGRGTIDGAGQPWWKLVRSKTLPKGLRPRLIEFTRCGHVRVEGITCQNSPSWQIHPVYCEDVELNGLKILAPADSPNTDGVDPDSSVDVRIINCTIDCGDDCIAIKSGKDEAGRKAARPCHKILVSGCTMLHGHGGVAIGSEMSAGVRDVTVKDCTFNGTDRGVRLKTRRGRGGAIEDVVFDGITMKGVKVALSVNSFYMTKGKDAEKPQPVDEGTPTIRNVTLRNLHVEGSAQAGEFLGLAERPLENITVKDAAISAKQGFVGRDVNGLAFENVKVTTESGPAVTFTRVQGKGW